MKRKLSFPFEIACTSGTNPVVSISNSFELLLIAVIAFVPEILTPVTLTPSSSKKPFSNPIISPAVLITPVGIATFNSPFSYSLASFSLLPHDASEAIDNAPNPKTANNLIFFILFFS